MAKSTAPMLLTTGISFGNQWLGNSNPDFRILVAGAIAAGGLALIEQVPGAAPLAQGIAWIAFITLMFTRLKGKPSPVDNLQKLTGFLGGIVSTIQKVALAIVAVGAITALVLPGRQSAQVIKAGGQAFQGALGTAITG